MRKFLSIFKKLCEFGKFDALKPYQRQLISDSCIVMFDSLTSLIVPLSASILLATLSSIPSPHLLSTTRQSHSTSPHLLSTTWQSHSNFPCQNLYYQPQLLLFSLRFKVFFLNFFPCCLNLNWRELSSVWPNYQSSKHIFRTWHFYSTVRWHI